MTRRRVLVVQPAIAGSGGGDQVAAWTLQALSELYDVTVLSWQNIDCAVVNQFCGTSLSQQCLSQVRPGHMSMRLVDLVPMRLALLRIALLGRAAKRLDRRLGFDVVISTSNEMNFGRVGVQYIHYPWSFRPRPDPERTWYTELPGALTLYHWLCNALAGGLSGVGMAGNISVANSRFIAEKVETITGRSCRVVFPPTPGHFDPLPWSERNDEMICVGRISGEKRTLEIIDIVDQVRRRGADLRLRVLGLPEVPAYVREVEKRAQNCGDWLRLELEPSRKRLLAVMHKARYGIHAMVEEHFGIAVAEMVRAGCVVFAHASGGPVEILGEDSDLLFRDTGDAVEKIVAVLSSEERRIDVEARLAARRERFGVEDFVRSMQAVVEEGISAGAPRGAASGHR